MKRTKGFTIIELLVVVTFFGILVALAIPAYQDFNLTKQCSELNSQQDIQVCNEWKIKKQGQTRHIIVPQATCIGGFLFAPNGTQIIGQNGGGVSCQ